MDLGAFTFLPSSGHPGFNTASRAELRGGCRHPLAERSLGAEPRSLRGGLQRPPPGPLVAEARGRGAEQSLGDGEEGLAAAVFVAVAAAPPLSDSRRTPVADGGMPAVVATRGLA